MSLLHRVLHKCALCRELLLLDSDAIATHLKSKHKGVTHREYNARHMVLGGKATGREEKVIKMDADQDLQEKSLTAEELQELEKQISKDKTELFGSEAMSHPVMENDEHDLQPSFPIIKSKVEKIETLSLGSPSLTNERSTKGKFKRHHSSQTDLELDESVGVESMPCAVCDTKLVSEADLLKHLRKEHYQQYLLALALQFFPGSACSRCGDVVKTNIAFQLVHIGEKHRQFPRQGNLWKYFSKPKLCQLRNLFRLIETGLTEGLAGEELEHFKKLMRPPSFFK